MIMHPPFECTYRGFNKVMDDILMVLKPCIVGWMVFVEEIKQIYLCFDRVEANIFRKSQKSLGMDTRDYRLCVYI